MTPKVRNCFEAAVGLGPEDTARFVAQFEQYKAAGASPEDAGRSAAADLLADIAAEAKEIGELIGGMVEDGAKAGTLTEAQARQRFNWQDMGTKDGTKTHALFFSDPADDRPMRYGEVSLFSGSTRFQVDGGESAATLKLAKAEAERVAIARLERDGYVGKTPQATAETVPAEPVSQDESEGPTPNDTEPASTPLGDALRQAKTISGAVKWIAENGQDPALRAIAARILPQVGNAEIVMVTPGKEVPGGVPTSLNISKAVFYENFNTGRKAVFVKDEGFSENGVSEETIIHEALHAATNELIREGNKRTNADTPLGKAVADLFSLQHKIVAELNARHKAGTQSDFEKQLHIAMATSDAREVLAWGMTNAEFQSMLKGIKVDGKPAWSQFVAAIRKVLGLGAEYNDALSELLTTADRLLSAGSLDAKVVSAPEAPAPGMGRLEVVSVYNTAGGKEAMRIKRLTGSDGAVTYSWIGEYGAGSGHSFERMRDIVATEKRAHRGMVLASGAEFDSLQPAPPSGPIEDVGEKIGGARKDTAISGGTRSKRASEDDRPAWARRFEISQIVTPGGQINEVRDAGRWVIRDTRSLDRMKQPKQVGRDTYATKEEAEAVIPLAAVSLKHRPVPVADGKYEIWRDITDRKRVKVLDRQFDTREEAMAYMAANAQSLIETNTTFGEADIPVPPDRKRTGPQRRTENATGEGFKDTFGFRAVEFGNWNNQDERQDLMNDAWDGLMDLADVLGVPPKALGLNGDLALAFGARGHGLNSARAHYELDRAVINLTKENGAGSLAHEWFHALDHYFGRQDGKASSAWVVQADGTRTLKVGGPEDGMASHGFQRGERSGVRPEVRAAYDSVLTTMFKKAEAYVEDTAKVDKFTGRAKEELAQALDGLRSELAAQKDPTYYKRNNKPASAELLAEVDALSKAMLEGEATALATEWKSIQTNKAKIAHRWTNDSLERLGAIYKEVRGRSGFDSTNRDGRMDRLRGNMERYSQRLKMLAEAQAGTEKTKMVPTEFAMNARELDQGRGTDYWTTPHEMAARAFQGYVEDKVAEAGGMSRFLNYGPANVVIITPWGFKRPFPAGTEREAINKAFDTFVQTLETKETDKGIALLSQAPVQPLTKLAASTTGTNPGKLTAMVANIRAGWADAPPVTVVATTNDLPAPIVNQLRSMNAFGSVRALVMPDTGQVYLIADRLPTLADAQFALFHEVLGHYGLRKFLGADYEKTMRQMRAMNAGLAAESRSWMAAYGTGQIEARVARGMSYADATVEVDLLSVEEALADRAGKPEQISGFKRLVAKLQAWLREHGFMEVAKWLEGKTQAQVLSLLQSARDAVEKAEGVHAYTGGAVVAASQTDQTDTPAFKRWFGASKVVDAEGKPLRVYHGTKAEFTEFKRTKSGEFGPAIYLTDNPREASEYGDGKGWGGPSGTAVMPLYVSIQNPYTKGVDAFWKEFGGADSDAAALDRAQAAGYDGIIAKRADRYYDNAAREFVDRGETLTHFIAFKPEQVKSAIGNSGAFDPSNPSILLSQHTPEQREALKRAGIAPKRRMKDNIRSAWEAAAGLIADRTDLAQGARQAMLDQFYGIQRAVQRDVGNLPLEQDPYVTARLANGGTSSVMRALLLHGQAQWAANGQHLEKKPGTVGLLDILKPLGDDLNDWFGWMIGNRAARLFKEGRENNFTEDQIKALQALGTPEKIAEFRKAALQYAAFKRSVLDVAEAAGLINKETRPAWDNADYIPFYRQIDEKATFSATGKKGLAGQSSGIRTLKGGESALHDPIENLLMNFSRLIDASLKNNALSRTVRVLEDAKSTALSKTGYTMSAEIVPRSQIEKALADAGTPDYILAGLPPEAFEGMAKMWAIQPPTDPSVIRIMRGGKPQFYKVHDPLLLKAATSFVPFDFPGLGVMRAFKRVLTAMVTSTPEFMLRNFIRDSAAVQGIARTGVNPAKSLSGIVRAFKEDGAAEHMLFAGASFQSGNTNATDPTGTATSIRRALRQKGMDAAAIDGFMATIVDKPARLWELYKHVGEAIENANREAIFEATAKKGSVTAAAYEAKDLMDFSLRGSHPLYQLAADVLPFFNARVQGLYRVGRSNPGRLAVYAGIMAALSVALVMANSGEDWYDELPDWDKDAYWHFMIGGTHFRIPKPFELGVAFATIPERIARYLDGQDSGSKTVGRLFANVRDQLAFDPIPQAIRPAMNVWANKDTFRGAPIENIADEGKLPHARYSATTSPTARLVTDTLEPATDAIGLSPKKLEYLIGGYLGTVGTYALGAADMAVRELQDAPAQPAPRLDDLPIVKAFVREAPARSTVYENDLYEVRDRIEKIYRSAAAKAKEGNIKGAKADLDKYKPEMKARGTVLSAAATLAGIRREREKVYADRAMTPEAKRERLDELQVMENKAVKKAMTDPKVKALQ